MDGAKRVVGWQRNLVHVTRGIPPMEGRVQTEDGVWHDGPHRLVLDVEGVWWLVEPSDSGVVG